MEGNNSSKGNTTDSNMASGPSASMSNTKLTSETLRLELREGEKQNHMQDVSVHQGATLANPALQKKKTPSFQITSVVYNVDGEESPDETEDMSDILDSSKMTDLDQETPSFSEEYSKSEDAGAPAAVIPTSSQYGITAVVQQNESGGLLTSRLPHGITVNVTKGGIALAEADGVVTSDTENLSNRFKIVKIASNKPFKKGRWVCFDFMDSPATAAVGIRNTESHQGVSIPLALVSQCQVSQASQSQHPVQQQVLQLQQGLQHQTSQIQQQFPISSQAGNTQQVSVPFTSQVPPQGYHSNVSNQPGSMSAQQVSQMSMQQQQHQQQQQQQQHQQQQQQHQLQQHLQQQQLQQQIQQNQPSVLPSQALENRQAVGASGQQPAINTNLGQSSPVAQGLSAVNIIQQQLQNQPQEQQLLQQASSQQSIQNQMYPQSVMTGHMASGQQMAQQQMQPSSSHTQQQQFQSQINQQQQQQQQQQLPQQSQQQQQQMQQQIQQQLQHQQSIPSQTIVVSQVSQGQDNLHLHKDPSPSAQPPNSCYQAIQQQQLQGSQQQQNMALSQQPTVQQLQQQQQGSSQVQLSQQPLTSSPSAGQVSHGGSSMSTNLSSYPSVPGLSSVANLSNINISKMITSHITAAEGTILVDPNEAAGEPGPSGGDDLGPGDEDKQSASTASTVAIDNKIEQAMDLVKSHLMFAVREEVDVLKERIGELMERINHLEYENTVLRKYATQEALQQIQQQHGGAPNP